MDNNNDEIIGKVLVSFMCGMLWALFSIGTMLLLDFILFDSQWLLKIILDIVFTFIWFIVYFIIAVYKTEIMGDA